MTSKQYFSTLLWIVKGGTVFMFAEALFHASGIRMLGVEAYWPESAVLFGRLFMMLWASASLVVGFVCYFIQKHLDAAKPLLVIMAVPAVLHALMLFWLSLTPFSKIMPLPNLYAWIPFYEVWIRGEGLTLIAYAGYICYGKWKKFL